MHKLLLILTLTLPAVSYAENWQLIADDGLRLVVDIDSPKVTPYKNDAGKVSLAVTAKMAYINHNSDPVVFVSGIDGDDCVYKGGGSIVNIYANRAQSSYFWSARGGRTYDSQGKWLCSFLVDFVEKADQEGRKNPASKKQNSKPKIRV